MLLGCAWFACGSAPPPNPEPPAPPDADDPAFHTRIPTWSLVGDAATPAQTDMAILVDAWPDGVDYVDAWVGALPPIRLTEDADGNRSGHVDVSSLPLGEYDVLVAANGSRTAFAKATLHRSAAYYVLVSTDWDFSDPGDQVIAYQDAFHKSHPEMRITHFVGPYTFTDPMVTTARQGALVDWLVKQRDTFHDEIGLHIHPYCNFVTHAGLTCVTDQSTVYPTDETGYTIKLGAYGRDNMAVLLQHASDLFAQHGLNRPVTFRAGGWTATLDTLHALADKGFTADTSALNWARIEEWKGVQNGELYRFNMANWTPIGDTSQPYYPSQDNILTTTAPTMAMLEVPDNGVMIDYVTLAEMTGIFDANWNGQTLAKPVTLMMGFHPSVNFSPAENYRVDMFLAYADKHVASQGTGPVVYITLNDVVRAFGP